MELFKEILLGILAKEEINMVFPGLKISAGEMVEWECYQALKKIKAIIENDSLSDRECFMQIEEIICVLERMGSSGGNRHDFG